MLKHLAALVKLAEIDVSARELETELEKAPARLEELRGDVKRLEELLNVERQQVDEATHLFAAQEEEIREQNQSLARSKAKSAKARTMREVEAVERELEVIRRTLRDREVERERLKEAIDQRAKILEQREKELRELVGYVESEEQKTRAGIQELEARKTQVLAGRDEVVSEIPRNVLRRYDMIRGRRGGIGVVRIIDDSCGGCHMVLPPQQANAVRQAETMEQCPRCQRILFALESLERTE